jgi:hypothetical protein
MSASPVPDPKALICSGGNISPVQLEELWPRGNGLTPSTRAPAAAGQSRDNRLTETACATTSLTVGQARPAGLADIMRGR